MIRELRTAPLDDRRFIQMSVGTTTAPLGQQHFFQMSRGTSTVPLDFKRLKAQQEVTTLLWDPTPDRI
jgi:hypothetical protein